MLVRRDVLIGGEEHQIAGYHMPDHERWRNGSQWEERVGVQACGRLRVACYRGYGMRPQGRKEGRGGGAGGVRDGCRRRGGRRDEIGDPIHPLQLPSPQLQGILRGGGPEEK